MLFRSIINTIITAVIEALPVLLDAAIQLFMALIQAIPTIIQALIVHLPKIITTIVTTLINNIPAIIQGAIQLFMGLIKAIPQIIVELVKNLPQIITSIVEGLIQGIPEIAKAGLQLIQGLWQGISDAAAWLWDQVSGFFNGLMDGIKGLFGIHSPSRVFRDEIGKNLALGVGEGFGDTMEDVSRQMSAAIPRDFDTEVNMGTTNGYTGYKNPEGFVQNVYIYSPKELSPSEVARQLRNVQIACAR